MTPDSDTVDGIIREVAASEIMPRFRRLAAHEIEEKSGPNDLVTVADVAAEEALTRRLASLTSGSAVVGEEAAARDPGIVAQLSDGGSAWIIDPIDGTLNYAEGRADFAVIVAYVTAGETVAAWIHDPVNDETVRAEQGAGAWSGERRLSVADAQPIGRMKAALYIGAKRAPALHERLKAVRKQLGPRSFRRCVGHEYMSLARGESHYAIFTRLLPWDHAGGILIHREAGGYNACFDRRPYSPAIQDGPFLLAPDEACWHALRGFFLKGVDAD